MFELKDKVAIVTGGAGLIGRHHCIALRNAGAKVYLSDLDEKTCEKAADELEVSALCFDVTSKESLEKAKEVVLKNDARIDILVNNAAINDQFENPTLAAEKSKFENYPLEMWDKMWQVNVSGVFLCCQIFGTEMVKNKSGSIINIASTYGIVAPDQSLYQDDEGNQKFHKSPAYPTNKAAVLGFTKFLAAYWGGTGVRVNALSPGGVLNGQDDYFVKKYSQRTPLKRMADASDYQGALLFLASDASGYATGSNVVVDGGWTIT